jgi:hypothetical protein
MVIRRRRLSVTLVVVAGLTVGIFAGCGEDAGCRALCPQGGNSGSANTGSSGSSRGGAVGHGGSNSSNNFQGGTSDDREPG